MTTFYRLSGFAVYLDFVFIFQIAKSSSISGSGLDLIESVWSSSEDLSDIRYHGYTFISQSRSPVDCIQQCVSHSQDCRITSYQKSSRTCYGYLNDVTSGTYSYDVITGMKSYKRKEASPQELCHPFKYEASVGLCYAVFGSQTSSYTAAETFCKGNGGHMVYLDTIKKFTFMIVELNSLGYGMNTFFWIGADDLEVEGTMKWRNGELFALPTSVWQTGEPSNDDLAEHCVALQHGLNLNDARCSSRYRIICEKDI